MNINLELYKVFYVVANAGSITKAAEELNISQPGVTQSIINLENQLGGKLFTRVRKGVVLTEEGKEFYKYIKQAMEYINNAENKFSQLTNLEIGNIRIGISKTLTKQFLLPYLEKFHQLYPKIDIQMYADLANDLLTMLKNGLVDIVILNMFDEHDKDIKLIPCAEVQDCFIGNEKYKDLSEKVIPLKELNNYPLVLQRKQTRVRMFLDDFAYKNNVTLNPIMNLPSYSLVVEFVKIGFGIGYATKDYIKNDLLEKKLYEIKTFPTMPKRKVAIAIMNNTVPSFSTKRLIDLITKES